MLSKPINTPDTTANYAGLLSAELFGQADTTTDEAVVNDFESVLGIDEMPDTIAAGKKMFWKPLYTISKQREIPTIL